MIIKPYSLHAFYFDLINSIWNSLAINFLFRLSTTNHYSIYNTWAFHFTDHNFGTFILKKFFFRISIFSSKIRYTTNQQSFTKLGPPILCTTDDHNSTALVLRNLLFKFSIFLQINSRFVHILTIRHTLRKPYVLSLGFQNILLDFAELSLRRDLLS